MYRLLKPWTYFDPIFNLMSSGKQMQSNLKTYRSFTDSVIATRKEKMRNNNTVDSIDASDQDLEKSPQTKRNCFMDLLIREHLSRPKDFTELNVRDEVNTFMTAGFETTGWSLIWLTYMLGHHQEIQERVQEEADSLFANDSDRELTLEDLDLPYIEAVIKETLRLYPPGPMFSRFADKETIIAGHKIPAGVTLLINLLGVHKDPNHWPEPEKFDPERFIDETNRHRYAFIPFSAGIRGCVGQKFTFLEEKILIAHMFHKFRITSLDSDIQPKMNVTFQSNSPIRLRLEPRFK